MLKFKNTESFQFCEMDYYQFRIAIIYNYKQISIRPIIDYISPRSFFTYKNKTYFIEQYPTLLMKRIPEWFDLWYNKGVAKKINNMRLTFEEKFLIEGMKKKIEEFYLRVGLISSSI